MRLQLKISKTPAAEVGLNLWVEIVFLGKIILRRSIAQDLPGLADLMLTKQVPAGLQSGEYVAQTLKTKSQ